MDDIFCLFEKEDHVQPFLDFLNSRHQNLRFTLEKEQNGVLPLLDIDITRTRVGTFETTTFRKTTFTGLLTNFASFIPLRYKVALANTLFTRAAKINSTEENLIRDKSKITGILLRNGFPGSVVNKIGAGTKLLPPVMSQKKENVETRHFKLPYIGEFSATVAKRLHGIVQKYCKSDLKFKIAFSTAKIGSYFNTKDRLFQDILPKIVYSFSCAGCNSCYIGETHRIFKKRVLEHLETDETSVVFKHLLANSECKRLCGVDCFSILDRATNKVGLKIKEAFHITKHSPNLNKQAKSLKVSLVI